MFNIDEVTKDREEDGVWADFKGSQFLIASSNRTAFQRAFAKLQMPHRRDIDRRRLDPEIQLDIMAKAMSSELLLDWRNVVDKLGNKVPYSRDTAYKVLKNNSTLRDFVTDFSTDLANYIGEEREELGKSVEKLSVGKSSSEKEKSS